MEVVLGHPTPYALGDISVGEAVSTAHQALSQAQHILHREGEDLADERRRLQLWASMLKRMTVSERAVAWALLDGVEIGLISRPSISALEVVTEPPQK
jgi:hypothetical protein